MSNYLPGETGAARSWEATYRCPDPTCGVRWTVRGTDELGGSFLDDDESIYCPDCGAEGKEV